jgi:hypothetical protein
LSLTLLLAAAGIPKVWPKASPRLVVRLGFLGLIAGIVVMLLALDAGAGPKIVTVPMLLAGLGVGALASQLGSVTVSSVPDEASGQVGGLQNTLTNLGASVGTALAGAVLISALSASFLTGIAHNPAVPADVVAEANTKLAGGVPFVSNAALSADLTAAKVPASAASAIISENEQARINGLRSALAVLAVIGTVGLALSGGIPAKALESSAAGTPTST